MAFSLVGLVDGAVRVLGVDPGLFLLQVQHFGFMEALGMGAPAWGEVPLRLLSLCQAVFHYGVAGVLVALLVGAWTAGLRPLLGLPPVEGAAVTRRAVSLILGGWLAVALYWWTRSVVYSGLPATDPRRLAAAGLILVIGLVLGAALVRFTPVARLRRVRLLLALMAAVGAGWGAVHWGRAEDRGRIQGANEGVPNVLLVVVDALRQDTLGPYGDGEVHTPSFDRLAAEGVTFMDARTQAPFTWPSFGSFLTGKVPRRHGLIRMEPGLRMPVNATLPILLKQAVTSAGDQLGEEDWVTGAFMTGTLSHGSGLLGGFDAYLHDGLGISEAQRAQLAANLLE